MYKSVDQPSEQNIEGFSYMNKNGKTELVVLYQNWVSLAFEEDMSDMNQIYYQDIPKTIKALEAAHAHWMRK